MDGEREKTAPWHAEEMLWCAGHRLSYRVLGGVIFDVFLPGCRTVPVDDLKSWAERNKVDFSEPLRVRGARGVTRVR